MILTALYTSNRVNIHFRFPHVDTSRDTECGMVALPPNVIGDAQTSTFAWDTLTSLVDVGGRMAGQDGERRGAQVMKAAFREAGLRSPAPDRWAEQAEGVGVGAGLPGARIPPRSGAKLPESAGMELWRPGDLHTRGALPPLFLRLCGAKPVIL